jgi:hypothetical protein
MQIYQTNDKIMITIDNQTDYLTHEKALKYGRKAANLSKANGVPVSKIADAKYGQVNAYHADVLRVVFSQPV